MDFKQKFLVLFWENFEWLNHATKIEHDNECIKEHKQRRKSVSVCYPNKPSKLNGQRIITTDDKNKQTEMKIKCINEMSEDQTIQFNQFHLSNWWLLVTHCKNCHGRFLLHSCCCSFQTKRKCTSFHLGFPSPAHSFRAFFFHYHHHRSR